MGCPPPPPIHPHFSISAPVNFGILYWAVFLCNLSGGTLHPLAPPIRSVALWVVWGGSHVSWDTHWSLYSAAVRADHGIPQTTDAAPYTR